MKTILLTLLILNTFLFAKLNVVVSILPEETFVKAIGASYVDVSLMVRPGNSPHTYEPKPTQMRAIAKANLYFAIDVEFEKVWLPKFRALNPTMEVVDLAKGIEKRPMGKKSAKGVLDPHIWTTPTNVEKIAKSIYDALCKADSAHSAIYAQNYQAFLTKIHATHQEIVSLFAKPQSKKKFMVFHPSWGYFAHTYGLTQIPVEVGGKSPKPRELIGLIQRAKKEHISAIFTQPEFSDQSAKLLAEALHIPVIKVSPLSADWSKNLLHIAHTIAGE
jgi:zinc transport system substrate-binding protein